MSTKYINYPYFILKKHIKKYIKPKHITPYKYTKNIKNIKYKNTKRK